MMGAVGAFVGIGSNLANPISQVRCAIQALGDLPGTQLSAASSLYISAPEGVSGQPDFVNAVAALRTELEAIKLLGHLQSIERRQGRVPSGERWGPRILDLDLLLYGQSELRSDGLQVPHPRMHERAFVLVPLAEIAPAVSIPGHGPVKALVDKTAGRAPELRVVA